jgi:sigma-B regulation protein RsbU (phosphoserine phosphatase)
VSKTRSFLSFSRKTSEVDVLKKELETLRRSVHELKILSDLAFAIGGSADTDEIVETLVDRLMHAAEAEQAVVTLLDHDEEDPMKTSIRLRATSAVDSVFRLSDSILGWMYLHKKALTVNDPKTDERFKRVPWDESIHSMLCVPLLVKSNLTGLITLYNKKVGSGFTEEDERLLNIIAAQSAQLIENARLFQESLKLAQVRQQQEAAWEIQRNLLPRSNPEIDGFDVAGASTPAQTVGGDYYDFVKMSGDRWGVFLGDVSGKGMPAALLMANLEATLRGQMFSEVAVDELVVRTNQMMCENTDDERFVTLFCSFVDPHSQEVSYCSAGHDPPLLLTRAGELTRLETTGIAVGVMEAAPYSSKTITMNEGDVLIIYSDGVPDATNGANEAFGAERLEEVVRENKDAASPELIEAIFKAVADHVDGAAQFDDLTIVVVRRKS